jgi:ribosomal protein L7Ae-like RNA K-turn-binding protein
MMNDKVYQWLGLACRAGKVVAGADSVKSASYDKLKCILISSDISDNARTRFEKISRQAGIGLYEVGDRYMLGKAIGKGERTVVGITDKGFSDVIKSILSGERGTVDENGIEVK